jgi:uncharacterized surface protein with fasciclin (FAS1) repeats
MKNLATNTPFRFRAFSLMTLLSLFLFSANAQTNVFDDVIFTSPDHTYLAAAIDQAGLKSTLQDPTGTFTVFAPTNDAFDDLAAALGTNINGLLAAPGLTDILLYHVLTSEVPSSAVTNGAIVTPANPVNTLKLTLTSSGSVFVNQAMVNAADLNTHNGIVHSIDAVVLPAETVADIAIDNGFTTLTTAVVTAELLPALTDPFATYTVFAPTNETFDNLATALGTDVNGLLALPNLADVLTYHVLGTEVPSSAVSNGAIVQPLSNTNTLKLTVTGSGEVFVNQAKVVATDIEAENGVVHVLDAVVLPVETVADVAIDNGFSTLTTAVVTAELLPALTDPFATYTVFAPTNAAFNDLATALGTDVNGLLALPILADVLTYHVLGTEVPSSAVSNGAIVQPLSATNTLKLTVTGNGNVFVNQAQVTGVDVEADNGVVHILNAVVLPVETVADVAIDNGFSTLTTAVVTAELLPALTDPFATYTVFAPTNAAFNDLATVLGTDINGLLALPILTDVLTYHVLGTEVPSSAVSNGAIVQPLSATNTLKLTVTGGGDVFVNQAQVTGVDVEADNGVVHILDAVVLPFETVADVAIDNGFSTLTTAVVTAELLPALTDPFATYTVFAPTNAAFNDLATALGTDINGLLALPILADVLTYHVLGTEVPSSAVSNGAIVQPLSATNTLKLTVTGGGDVFVNQAQVTGVDVEADNGIVHILDAVVLPFETVADVAIDNGFSTLTTAVVKAELLPALTDPFATYTVFAPTNEAFDDLASALGTDINGILALPNLADVLTYHVADVTVLSTDLVEGTITMLNGGNVMVDLSNGVMINDANVVLADVSAANGVVHVIDKVLLEMTTSAGDVDNIRLKAFPNPASDIIMIEGITEGEYELFSVSGALVKSGIVDKYIDVANLQSGTYLLRIQANNSIFNLPISKL